MTPVVIDISQYVVFDKKKKSILLIITFIGRKIIKLKCHLCSVTYNKMEKGSYKRKGKIGKRRKMLNRSLIHEGNKAIGLFVPGDVFRPKAVFGK